MDWPPYLLKFNLLDFSISRVLQTKFQATPHSNLAAPISVRRRGIGLASGGIYLQDMRLFPLPPLSRRQEK